MKLKSKIKPIILNNTENKLHELYDKGNLVYTDEKKYLKKGEFELIDKYNNTIETDKNVVFLKKRISSLEKKKEIYSNENLKNNQNYILSRKKTYNILSFYASSKFSGLEDKHLYFLDNNDLEYVDHILGGEKTTIGFYVLFMTLMLIFQGIYSDINMYFLLGLIIIFLLLFFVVFFTDFTLNKRIKDYKKKDSIYKKIYFIRDTEGIFYFKNR